MIRIIFKNYDKNLKHMEYNSNNILKTEHFFHIPKDKGQNNDEKVTFVLKNVCLCYFSIPFFLTFLIIFISSYCICNNCIFD